MDIIHITSKGKMMDTIEKYYIYRETKLNNQINDKLTVQPNIIFETLLRQDPHRGLCNTYNPQLKKLINSVPPEQCKCTEQQHQEEPPSA